MNEKIVNVMKEVLVQLLKQQARKILTSGIH